MKNWSDFPTPLSHSRSFIFNVVVDILSKMSFICYWDAARHADVEKIKINNALIYESYKTS